MSESENTIREAAAVGAAAAVDAVVEEQHEDERADAVANAATMAAEATEQAEQEAQAAAEAATAATVTASEARADAEAAEATAEQAAAEAEQASGEAASLRETMAAGFSELRGFIMEQLAPKEPSEEPTEVVVTHADSGRNPEQTGTDTGSGGSAPTSERAYRHRFGRRI